MINVDNLHRNYISLIMITERNFECMDRKLFLLCQSDKSCEKAATWSSRVESNPGPLKPSSLLYQLRVTRLKYTRSYKF